MRYNCPISSLQNETELSGDFFDEFLLESSDLSRVGSLCVEEMCGVARGLNQLGKRVVLVWDLLMTQSVFEKKQLIFEAIDLTLFDAVRVSDPGAYHYLNTKFPNTAVQLVLDNGNHNLAGILGWEKLSGNLERLVLSSQLPFNIITQYCINLSTDVEIQIFGKIPLFYSPRKLLNSHLEQASGSALLEAVGTSEESPHKGFTILENEHGTFMYHPKELSLMDRIEKLNVSKIKWGRFDLRHPHQVSSVGVLEELVSNFSASAYREFRESYSHQLIRGFFEVNKTDAQFKNLVNRKVQRKDENYLGEIAEVKKERYLGIDIKKCEGTLRLGQKVLIKTPDGKELLTSFKKCFDVDGVEIQTITKPGLYRFNFIPKTSKKSQIYLYSGE
ncbi:MAG: hypothetical protein HOE90_14385 [Bacteriovoracaceae bacterium]|jgi:U32 family peptidase|nr:hypothetical protein [Bacteriovoracaceae bacterium]